MGQAIGIQAAILPKPCMSLLFTIISALRTSLWGLYPPTHQLLISLFRLRAPDHALAQLFDSAEPVPFQTIRQVIHSELGEWPESLFIEFDEKPLGSAVSPSLSVPSLITILPHTHS